MLKEIRRKSHRDILIFASVLMKYLFNTNRFDTVGVSPEEIKYLKTRYNAHVENEGKGYDIMFLDDTMIFIHKTDITKIKEPFSKYLFTSRVLEHLLPTDLIAINKLYDHHIAIAPDMYDTLLQILNYRVTKCRLIRATMEIYNDFDVHNHDSYKYDSHKMFTNEETIFSYFDAEVLRNIKIEIGGFKHIICKFNKLHPDIIEKMKTFEMKHISMVHRKPVKLMHHSITSIGYILFQRYTMGHDEIIEKVTSDGLLKILNQRTSELESPWEPFFQNGRLVTSLLIDQTLNTICEMDKIYKLEEYDPDTGYAMLKA